MADYQEEMRGALQKFVGRYVPMQTLVGEVLAVDAAERTCDVLPFGADAVMLGVRLQARTAEGEQEGIWTVPKVGSDVVVEIIGNERAEGYVAMMTEVDTLHFKGKGLEGVVRFGSGEIEVKAGKVSVNEGLNGGMVKVNELRVELGKVNVFMQAILTILRGAPIPETGGGAPSSLQAALLAATAIAQVPNYGGIENEDFKH